ncbi:MAG: PhnD/SsuA/transferrin family substrate-binding protein, partial [Thiomicrorhabdus sp.]|nr:PhnD/SsuA/transferrin family substrate-binding protein [Thiomicrorhabdus sp.]
AAPVRFGPLPMYSEEHIRQEFYPFIKYLESVLQRPVQFAYRSSNKDVIDALISDEIDLAFLGPLPFALISKQDPDILPLLQFLNADGSVGYTCSVGVFSGDHLRISDLKNKQFALTQSYSTCGFLMTEHLLNQQGLSLADNEFEYIGSHPNCALGVIDGKFSACGIKTSIGKQFYPLGLDLIAESEPVPSYVLVANRRTLTAAEVASVRKHLLALKPLENKQDAELTKDWGNLIKYGTSPVTVDDFRMINDLINRMDTSGVFK